MCLMSDDFNILKIHAMIVLVNVAHKFVVMISFILLFQLRKKTVDGYLRLVGNSQTLLL